jgi:hypothetical protein
MLSGFKVKQLHRQLLVEITLLLVLQKMQVGTCHSDFRRKCRCLTGYGKTNNYQAIWTVMYGSRKLDCTFFSITMHYAGSVVWFWTYMKLLVQYPTRNRTPPHWFNFTLTILGILCQKYINAKSVTNLGDYWLHLLCPKIIASWSLSLKFTIQVDVRI